MMEKEDRPPRERGQSRSATAQAVIITLLLVGLLTAIFVLQNTARSEVNFLFWSVEVPLAGALMLAGVLGGIIGFLVAFIRQRAVVKRMSEGRGGGDGPRNVGGSGRERPPITES